jgi:hypothetical protein
VDLNAKLRAEVPLVHVSRRVVSLHVANCSRSWSIL